MIPVALKSDVIPTATFTAGDDLDTYGTCVALLSASAATSLGLPAQLGDLWIFRTSETSGWARFFPRVGSPKILTKRRMSTGWDEEWTTVL